MKKYNKRVNDAGFPARSHSTKPYISLIILADIYGFDWKKMSFAIVEVPDNDSFDLIPAVILDGADCFINLKLCSRQPITPLLSAKGNFLPATVTYQDNSFVFSAAGLSAQVEKAKLINRYGTAICR